jgi:hypothetical protein
MTKTCLDVLTNLGKAFQNAVKEGFKRPKMLSPYMVQNDTGLVITLLLDRGPFQVRSNNIMTLNLFCVCSLHGLDIVTKLFVSCYHTCKQTNKNILSGGRN